MKEKLKVILLLGILLFPAAHTYSQQLEVFCESSVFISGDPVRLQIIPMSDGGNLSEESTVVTTFLVSHTGNTLAQQRFLITPLEKGAVMVLPKDLETGPYKLISVMEGGREQNELKINIYNPSIFSSSAAPKNADSGKGLTVGSLNSREINVRVAAGQERGNVVVPAIDQTASETAIALIHVFHEEYGQIPVQGENIPSQVGDVEIEYSIDWLTEDPNSRISFYFLDQGLVEEYYLADGDRIYTGLQKHYGGGPVWAYQFDSEGNRLGQVDIDVRMSNVPNFKSFQNTVPYNEKIRSILENKRIRKFVDQVYKSDGENTSSILDEEYDRSSDATVKPERYEGYATLREALANIVPKTQVIRRSGSYELRLSPSNSGFRYPEAPLVLLNGVPTYSPDSLMEIPFRDLEEISIYNSIDRLRRFGTLGRFGVIDIKLKPGVENPLDTFRSELPVMRGISDVIISKPSYDEESPDLRGNIFWDPSVRIYLSRPNEIAWKMSDLPGKYRVWGMLILPGGERRYFDQEFIHLNR